MMKKTFLPFKFALTILIALFTSTLYAQTNDTMFVHKGHNIYEFASHEVDSMNFKVDAHAEISDTLFIRKGENIYKFATEEVDSIIFYRTRDKIYIVDISEETDWHLMIAATDGSSIFLNIDEDTSLPTQLFCKPDKDIDEGFSIFFQENGLPETMVVGDYIIYFGNFRGTLFDFALIHPDNSIEYFYDIDAEIDWDNLSEPSLLRLKLFGINLNKVLKVAGDVLGVSTCVVSPFCPVLLAPCGAYVVSQVGHVVVDKVLDGFAADLAHTVIDMIGCAGGAVSGAIDCASALIGTIDMLSYINFDLANQKNMIIVQASNQINASNPTPLITIAAQPRTPNNVLAGFINGSLSVSASVTQSATLSYQWYSNTIYSNIDGTLISGATSANFQIPTNLTAGTYYYFCEINATGGATTRRTSAATVHVASPVITINTHPTSFNATVGNITGNLNVNASITPGAMFGYQWYSNTTNSNTDGTEISGATSATFAVPTTLDEGTYYYFCEVRATSSSVFVRSNVATVNVQYAGTPLITINNQPEQTTNVIGGSITGNLSVNASVTFGATLSYQWYSNTTNSNTSGTEILNATSASFPIPTTLTAGTYYYFCEVRATGGATSLRTNVARVGVNHFVVETTTDWNAALAAIRNGGSGTSGMPKKYVININGAVNIPGSANSNTSFGTVQHIEVTLTGSGTLSLNSNGSILYIGNNQNLIIDGENLMLQGYADNNRALFWCAGQLELKNGAIKNNANHGVFVSAGAIFGDESAGTFIMTGGTISDNYISGWTMGAGVFVGGTFEMTGGVISNNNANGDINSGGGGVYVSGNFTMSGGSISANTTSGRYGGGGVLVSTNATFTMTGGIINGNTATNDLIGGGGGVSVDGTFIMTGGTITGNSALSSGSGGGGVSIVNGSFQMSGGIISNNTAFIGGGVYGSSSSLGNSSFTKSGGGIIYGINAGSNSNISNVFGTQAVYVWWASPNDVRFFRQSTLGENDNISTDNPSVGWGQ